MIEFVNEDVQCRYDRLVALESELSSELEDVQKEICELEENNERA